MLAPEFCAESRQGPDCPDILNPGSGRDFVGAGPGNDQIDARGRAENARYIRCAEGRDRVHFGNHPRPPRTRACEQVSP